MGVGMFMLAWEHSDKEEKSCLKLNLVWRPKPSFDFDQRSEMGRKERVGSSSAEVQTQTS